jgi:hypothetical protein
MASPKLTSHRLFGGNVTDNATTAITSPPPPPPLRVNAQRKPAPRVFNFDFEQLEAGRSKPLFSSSPPTAAHASPVSPTDITKQAFVTETMSAATRLGSASPPTLARKQLHASSAAIAAGDQLEHCAPVTALADAAGHPFGANGNASPSLNGKRIPSAEVQKKGAFSGLLSPLSIPGDVLPPPSPAVTPPVVDEDSFDLADDIDGNGPSSMRCEPRTTVTSPQTASLLGDANSDESATSKSLSRRVSFADEFDRPLSRTQTCESSFVVSFTTPTLLACFSRALSIAPPFTLAFTHYTFHHTADHRKESIIEARTAWKTNGSGGVGGGAAPSKRRFFVCCGGGNGSANGVRYMKPNDGIEDGVAIVADPITEEAAGKSCVLM